MSLKTLKIAFHFLLFITNILIAIGLVVSAFSDRIPPEKSVFLAYVGLFFPFLCVFLLCYMLYWLFLQKWKYLLVNLFTILVCWGAIQRYFPVHMQSKDVPTENTIKILTYNVMSFGYQDHTKDKPNEILEYIAKSDADIVCLQEYFENRSNKHLSSSKIHEVLKMYPYYKTFFSNANEYYKGGIAVFSKYPITKSRLIKYQSENNASSIHEISIKKKKIVLINNHLESFKLTSEDRSKYSEFLKNPGTELFDGIKGSFQQKLGPAFIIRSKQARKVREEIDKVKADYILVCGDFNDTPISYAHRTIQGDLYDAFARSGSGLGVTYNRNVFRFRIDNILHSSNMKAYNCTVDKIYYSDHYPLWCYLQMN
ncbi:endonuclease/exonuclease/phosphatase family protein [Massilibacteroides sp.]|uniref:endonuclease/exonuclease/phosphatase family protein n=1 Tax=Massilibacteroides sp. TaxID=2034766 RepID=UPI002616CA63|nr:endonuclease/exonuclease/phosphatase family protein [Massilibacteroides sp.]MDD4514704.1 endonuclease/exonuclease/phosphatase family protein [Massilibacteroides sp.]